MRSSNVTIGVFSNPLIGGGHIAEANLLAETLRGSTPWRGNRQPG